MEANKRDRPSSDQIGSANGLGVCPTDPRRECGVIELDPGAAVNVRLSRERNSRLEARGFDCCHSP
jgi:hypothetical protein